MAFSELYSQTEVIFYYDDHLLPCDRTKGIGNVKNLNTQEQEICNVGTTQRGWEFFIFHYGEV